MPAKKTAKKTTKKASKKTSKKVSKKPVQPPPEQFGKVYISSQMAGTLIGCDPSEACGESFWVVILDKEKNTAEVRNNCLCGLCVGDVIEFEEYLEDDGVHHPREFVKVIRRVAEAFRLYYTFPGLKGMTFGDKFPEDCQKHIWKIEKKKIRFEGSAPGLAIISKPVDMSDEELFSILNSGPMTFSTSAIED